MKTIRRILSFAFALCLIFSSLCLSIGAADSVTFTATNDTLCELNDATMPFYQGGTLYVSAELISGSALGVYFSTLRGSNAAVLYRQRDTITIDMSSKTAVFNGRIYSGGAAIRNGRVFVSSSLLSSCFGFSTSSIKVENGTLVRVCSKTVLSDTAFADAAKPLMQQRYAQYERAHHTEKPQTAPIDTPTQNTTTDTTPTDTTLYCSVCAHGEDLERILQTLSSRRLHANILAAPKSIVSEAASLRRAVATGNGIVLRMDGADAETLLSRIESANETLRAVCGGCTRLVYVENTTAEVLTALQDAGYCPITYQVMRTSFRPAALSAELLRYTAGGTCRLLLDGDNFADSFASLVSALQKGNCTLRAVNEVNYD